MIERLTGLIKKIILQTFTSDTSLMLLAIQVSCISKEEAEGIMVPRCAHKNGTNITA